jgi:hypothetical protein
MAKPGDLNLNYVEGDDESYAFALKDSGGSPIDLTGSTIECEVRQDYGTTPVATAVCTITNAAGGTFTVELDKTDTRAMAGGTFKYDVQITNASAKTRTYVRGELSGTQEVTV